MKLYVSLIPLIKSSHFTHPEVVFWSYPPSQMTITQFESRITRNFVTNPESRRQKRSYPASCETPSDPHKYLSFGPKFFIYYKVK